jgi:hypothetical protein
MSVATNELAGEAEIVAQAHEGIKWIVWEAGVLTLRQYSKLFHVVFVAGRMRAEMISDKAQAFADVKL